MVILRLHLDEVEADELDTAESANQPQGVAAAQAVAVSWTCVAPTLISMLATPCPAAPASRPAFRRRRRRVSQMRSTTSLAAHTSYGLGCTGTTTRLDAMMAAHPISFTRGAPSILPRCP